MNPAPLNSDPDKSRPEQAMLQLQPLAMALEQENLKMTLIWKNCIPKEDFAIAFYNTL